MSKSTGETLASTPPFELRRLNPHPFHVMRFSTTGAPAMLVGAAFLGSLWAQAATEGDQPRFRVSVRAAQFIVRALDDRGRPLKGLTADDVRVLEDDLPRPIELFEEHDDAGISLAILLDVGSTMKRQSILDARRYIQELIHLLAPDDEILLATYDTDVHFLSELSSDRYALVDAIQNIASGARAGKWKRAANLWMSSANTGYAVDHSLLRLKKAHHPANKAVLAISAGFGGIGEATLDHLAKASTRFFAVALNNRAGDIFSLGGDQVARRRIVRETGGFAYSVDEVLEKLDSIRDTLKQYYLLAYVPREGEDDWTKRRLRIDLPGHPKARVALVRRTSSNSSFY